MTLEEYRVRVQVMAELAEMFEMSALKAEMAKDHPAAEAQRQAALKIRLIRIEELNQAAILLDPTK